MSGKWEIVFFGRVELAPLAPLSRDNFELVRVRVSGRLYCGASALRYVRSLSEGAQPAGELYGGVDFVEVERYELVRIRGVSKDGPRVDPVFDQVAALKQGEQVYAVIHRAWDTFGEQKYPSWREQVHSVTVLADVLGQVDARIFVG